MSIKIIDPGFICTVQDLGRSAYQRYGMPLSGAMDAYALAAANILVDNQANTAALEFNAVGPTFETQTDCLIAVTGHGIRLWIEEKEFPTWMSIFIRRGRRIRIEKTHEGTWGYAAFAGGIAVKPVMGSTATYLRAGIGGFEGRTLQDGDILPLGIPDISLTTAAGREFLPKKRPDYTSSPTLRVILGPQDDFFSPDGLQAFLASEYCLTDQSDRMGYRLEGTRIAHRTGADIISDGVVTGAVQVPANGQPIIMMADHQTTGGYAKIATVIRADLPLLAQSPPGTKLRFCRVSPQTALVVYQALMKDLLEKNWSLHETFIDNMRA